MGSSKWFWFRCVVYAFLLTTLSFQPLSAQTFSEWFKQGSTQKKYLLAQIAALQQYASYARQGYAIAQNGLGGIGNWLKGEFGLHEGYYASLKRVNPAIRSNPKANACVAYASDIARLAAGIDGDHAAVGGCVLDDTDADIAELEMVMTNGKAELTDDERLVRLTSVYKRLLDRYAFVQGFVAEARFFDAFRDHLLDDVSTGRRLYGN